LVLTVQRKVPIERAIPAGAFLLFFIGLFGWGIYRAKRGSAWADSTVPIRRLHKLRNPGLPGRVPPLWIWMLGA